MFGKVERVKRLTPHMVRVVLEGEGLDDFSPISWTDSYLNVYFLPPGAPYSVPFDINQVRMLPREQQPSSRRYTVRDWDAQRRQLTIDFVVHGDTGVASRWAQLALPGDLLQFTGPSGSYSPDPDADWHLMIGDDSALPAIATSLTAIPPGKPVHVLAEVHGVDDELALESPGELHLIWLHRNAHPSTDDLLLRALNKLDPPAGQVHAFVHGEAVGNRALRKHLLGDWKIPRKALSVSPYWRRTYTDESWRQVKQNWLLEVERDI